MPLGLYDTICAVGWLWEWQVFQNWHHVLCFSRMGKRTQKVGVLRCWSTLIVSPSLPNANLALTANPRGSQWIQALSRRRWWLMTRNNQPSLLNGCGCSSGGQQNLLSHSHTNRGTISDSQTWQIRAGEGSNNHLIISNNLQIISNILTNNLKKPHK